MFLFSPKPTKIAEWHALVTEASLQAGYQFEDSVENYLVLTLDHFTTEEEIASSVIALDFLESMQQQGSLRDDTLRHIGDQCLIISGLFPERAAKKNVSLSYFIEIGQQAYINIATLYPRRKLDPELFFKLGYHFVGLMDVLHAMRLMPLQRL